MIINLSILNHLYFSSFLRFSALSPLLDFTPSSILYRLRLVILKSLLLNLTSLIWLCFWLSLGLLSISICCCLIIRSYFFWLSALILWLLSIRVMRRLNLHCIFVRISLVLLLVYFILDSTIDVLILSIRICCNIRISLSIFSLGVRINFIRIINLTLIWLEFLIIRTT